MQTEIDVIYELLKRCDSGDGKLLANYDAPGSREYLQLLFLIGFCVAERSAKPPLHRQAIKWEYKHPALSNKGRHFLDLCNEPGLLERAKGAFEFDDCSWSIFDFYEYLKRQSSSGKIADEYINTANKIIAGDSVAEAVATIESKMPYYKVAVDADGNVTAEALARGIAALNKHLIAEGARRASWKKLAFKEWSDAKKKA